MKNTYLQLPETVNIHILKNIRSKLDLFQDMSAAGQVTQIEIKIRNNKAKEIISVCRYTMK